MKNLIVLMKPVESMVQACHEKYSYQDIDLHKAMLVLLCDLTIQLVQHRGKIPLHKI